MTPVRVLTVDDEPVFLEAARALIASTEGFALAGEATSGVDAIKPSPSLKPDLVLLDVRMPGLDGIETAGRLADRHAGTVVVLVSGHDLDDVRRWRSSAARSRWCSRSGCGRGSCARSGNGTGRARVRRASWTSVVSDGREF